MNSYEHMINLLIVDDHQLIVDGLSRIVTEDKSIGTVYQAHNGAEAISIVMEFPIDCVLMDINMPGINGYEATRMIKKERPGVKIIIVSMLGEPTIVNKLLKAGADAFLIKNTGTEELLSAIRKVMRGEKYVGEKLSSDLYHHLSAIRTSRSGEPRLTPREKEVIRFIAEGMTNHEIAVNLFLSPSTIDTHRKNILAKLGLKNTALLIKYAVDNNLL
jgi:two-component system, NarL family, nitrate/nitrite response regulator NarL